MAQLDGSDYVQGACIQDSPAVDTFLNALNACRGAGGRLPSPAELLTLVARGVTDNPATAAEWTDTISFDGTNQRVEEVDLEGGSGAISSSLINNAHPYRCVFDPTG